VGKGQEETQILHQNIARKDGVHISECIALAKAREEETGEAPVLDPDFAEDVEEILSHRKL
jgi:hypothetical protein